MKCLSCLLVTLCHMARFAIKQPAVYSHINANIRGFLFSRSAMSAKNNFDSFRENCRVGGSTRRSLDRSTMRKENLRPKYLKRKGMKKYLQYDGQRNKKNIFLFRRLNKMIVPEQNNKMSVLFACYVVSYDTFSHKTIRSVF